MAWKHTHRMLPGAPVPTVEVGINAEWPAAWMEFTLDGHRVAVNVALPDAADGQPGCTAYVVIDDEDVRSIDVSALVKEVEER